MKKYLLVIVFAFAAAALQAQQGPMYSLLYHERPMEHIIVEGLMQQRDGDFVLRTYLYEATSIYDGNPLGHMFYKVSSTDITITDSLFITDTTEYRCYSFALNPQGEGNILINGEYQENCDSTFLRISHFPDDDLNTTPEEDVVIPLCEGFTWPHAFVDSRGDLIVQYLIERSPTRYDEYVARFDLDGTLKYQTMLFENVPPYSNKLLELKESPLQYYKWEMAETNNQGYNNIVVYVMDSLFHKNPVILNSLLSSGSHPLYGSKHIRYDGDLQIIPAGGDNILLAAKYEYDTTGNVMEIEHGVVVAKYDLRTMQLKGFIEFNDYLGINRPASCMGIKMMTDGTVYFMYKEDGYPQDGVVVVKMDSDLNVEWKCFCKTDGILIGIFSGGSILFKDEQGEEAGIVWLKAANKDNHLYSALSCFVLKHNGTVSTSEVGMEVRPYTFYPNPVQDLIRMQFSPYVQPARVELYDLQGRLVRTQSKAFENIDMSQLPSGTYTMRVTMEDGKTYSDKVVKE